MRRKHVFVVGLDKYNREKLKYLPQADGCEFHPALSYQDIQSGRQLDMEALINLADLNIRSAGVPVDAIISFYDFPATLLVPVLAKRFAVQAPSLENVLKCEHKLWSRIEQQKIISEHIPQFFTFDPYDDKALEKIPLQFPYWIKPVKSFLSFLAYRINSGQDYYQVLPEIREKAVYFDEPFHHILEQAEIPDEITEREGKFIAESLLTGQMCTTEGYVFDGDVVIYGMVDSVCEGGKSSFARYDYPSSIPPDVQLEIIDIARKVIAGTGLNNSAFNIEFFWDQKRNQIRLLEINPRVSESHADLFEKVHGRSHISVLLDVALGKKPAEFEYSGMFRRASKFMYRTYKDGVVTRVPDKNQLRRISEKIPGTVVKPAVKTGDRLSELPFQDSYSYLLASIFIGGSDQADLLDKYNRCLKLLDFRIRSADRQLIETA